MEAIYPENKLADLYKVSPFSSFPATLNRCNRVLLSNLQTGAWKKEREKKIILGPKIVINARNDFQIFWTVFLSGLRNCFTFFQWGFTFGFTMRIMNFLYFLAFLPDMWISFLLSSFLCELWIYRTSWFPIYDINFFILKISTLCSLSFFSPIQSYYVLMIYSFIFDRGHTVWTSNVVPAEIVRSG